MKGKTRAPHSGVVPVVHFRIKAWRQFKKLKGFQVCKLIKVSQGSYSDIESGKSYPSAQTLTNMINYSDLNIIWLLTGDGNMIRKNQSE